MDADEFVEAYRAANSMQAHLMLGALEDAGIKAIIDGDQLQSAAGIPPGWSIEPRILVAPANVDRARELLEQMLDSEPEPIGDDETGDDSPE